jgi:hypothetical protein
MILPKYGNTLMALGEMYGRLLEVVSEKVFG